MFYRVSVNLPFLFSWLLLNASAFAVNPPEVQQAARPGSASLKDASVFRGPVDLILSEDELWAVTVNELSGTLSLIDLQRAQVVEECKIGDQPGGLSSCGASDFLVSCRYSGEVFRYRVEDGGLKQIAQIHVGFEPLGIAANERRAYIGLQATGELAEIDLESNCLVRRFAVGSWPRYLALSEDGDRIAVGLSGSSQIAVVDAQAGQVLYEEPLSGGINIGHLQISKDGSHVYFPWMIYRSNPITKFDIQRGWILASRIARIRMDGPAYREAISLDVPRRAVADPLGLVVTPNEHRLAVTSSGTHELLVYRLADLPFIGAGGPGDLIDRRLLDDSDLFYRIELGGRPMGMASSRDNRTVWIANHLLDCIQQVDLESREIVQEISLGKVSEDEHARLVHRGRTIFHDAERSLDQWYSCHSCHLDGGTNAKAMDTWNDGTELTTKTVLPLTGVTETGPWTWHGWQEDLQASLQNSFVSTMQGEEANQQDLDALRAYLESLTLPPNPFVGATGQLSASAQRGKELFESDAVGCYQCHSGPRLTDGDIHDVGMTRETDKYQGYNTPSLRGIYRKPRLLHDGRAKDLETVLGKWHRPEEIGGGMSLNPSQLSDLIEYLKTL